jgi:hypothetical protein
VAEIEAATEPLRQRIVQLEQEIEQCNKKGNFFDCWWNDLRNVLHLQVYRGAVPLIRMWNDANSTKPVQQWTRWPIFKSSGLLRT